jgi:hypothetical protein
MSKKKTKKGKGTGPVVPGDPRQKPSAAKAKVKKGQGTSPEVPPNPRQGGGR